jgi:hypothetical protein
MRSSILFSVTLAALLSGSLFASASAEEQEAALDEDVHEGLFGDDADDPENLLPLIKDRRAQRDSLFRSSPFTRFHESSDRAKQEFYEKTHLNLGVAFNHLFQWLSEAPLSDERFGTASSLSIPGTWELVDRGGPKQGQLYFKLEGRWQYGYPGPEVLAVEGVGSLIGTANTYSEYVPTFILRNIYWQQGSKKAGWAYRAGKTSPDATLSTSAHINAFLTFLPTGGTGPFANALPDSGLGLVGSWYFNDRVKMLALISDANGDRFNFGDITAGDFYTAAELAVKIAPRTPKSGFSKLTVWHTEGTKDGQPANGNLGPSGWGFFLKWEQELSKDGRAIGVARYGWSSNGSAFYEEQAGAHFLLYDPTPKSGMRNDLVGVALNWAQSAISGTRGETNFEFFYRFPIVPQVDTTLSYQSIFNPALDRTTEQASVFSLRLRTTY